MSRYGRKVGWRNDTTEQEKEVIYEFANLVRTLRREHKMTLLDLALASNRSPMHIFDIEKRNTKIPNFASVIRLLDVFGYKIKYVKK